MRRRWERSQDSSRLTSCRAGDDPSPRSPNRRTRSNNLPRCCGNPRSVNRPHRIAIDSSDNGHAMRPTAQPLTLLRWMRLAASLTTRSERHARRVEQDQVSPPPTKRGVKPRPGSSSSRPARRRTGRVTTPLTHRGPTATPTLRRRPSAGADPLVAAVVIAGPRATVAATRRGRCPCRDRRSR